MIHDLTYNTFGDYEIQVTCSNCVSSKEFTMTVQVDEEITGSLCQPSPSGPTNYEVNEGFSIECSATAGSRIQFYLDDGTEVKHFDDTGQGTRTHIFTGFQYSSAQNVTLSLVANNSASSDTTDIEIQIQVPVQVTLFTLF